MTTPLPARGERTAPKFDTEYEEQLPTFFDEFEAAASAAGITDDVQLKKACLRYVDVPTIRFWKSVETYKDDTKTWKEFRKEVTSHYPRAEGTAEVTIDELLQVIENHRKSGIYSVKTLASYHREFVTLAAELEFQGTLPKVQTPVYYAQVFDEQFRNRLELRLQVQIQNKPKGTPYTLAQLKAGAEFLLTDTSTSLTSLPNLSLVRGTTPTPSSTTPTLELKLEGNDPQMPAWMVSNIEKMMEERLGSGRKTAKNSSTTCFFNHDHKDHTARNCPEVQQWIAEGKCTRDENGLILTKAGNRIPREVPGRDIKERLENYYRDHPSELSMILDTPIHSPHSSRHENVDNRFPGVAVSTHNTFTLRGQQGWFDAFGGMLAEEFQSEKDSEEWKKITELMLKMQTRREARSNKATSSPPSESKDTDEIVAKDASKPAAPIEHPAKLPRPVIGNPPVNYAPPKDQVNAPVEKEDMRNYRFKAPIETDDALTKVTASGLKSTITLTQAELLAICPDYRKQIRFLVSPQRVGVNNQQPQVTTLVAEDPVESFLNAKGVSPENIFQNEVEAAEVGDRFFVGRESQAIRAVNAQVGEQKVHCILDNGCSIVAMSEAACTSLRISFDPTFKIPVQSANGVTDWSMGLARDVPFRFGDVVVFLQVHIIRSAAYDVLLGRPFYSLTQLLSKDYASGEQHITIHDPNTHRTTTIPTSIREPPRYDIGGSCT